MELKNSLKSDLISGLVVSFVALPLCLGIALASGSPLISGLITGIIGGIVVGVISRSSLGVSGPAAGLTVIVFAAIAKLGFTPFLLAVLLAGVFQIIASLLKAGVIAHFFPSSVIRGMLSGIGIILIIKQLTYAFGFDYISFQGEMDLIKARGGNSLSGFLNLHSFFHQGATLITLVSLGILIFMDSEAFKKRHPKLQKIPPSLVVILLGVGLNFIYQQFFPSFQLTGQDLENGQSISHLVNLPIVKDFNGYTSIMAFPDFKSITNIDVWKAALTLFLVASLESLLSLEATDKLDPYRRHSSTNRELLAQGFGNITAALLGGMPLTQVIIRSATNVNSGGKTKKATIFHGIFLLIFVLFIPKVINLIPLASLAAILFMVGYKLASIEVFKSQWAMGRSQFLPYLTTILGLIFTDMLTGIALGMTVAIFEILRVNYGRPFWGHDNIRDEKNVIIKLPVQLNYLNSVGLSKLLNSVNENSRVVIDGKDNIFMSAEVLEVIKDFEINAPTKNIRLEIKNLKGYDGPSNIKPYGHKIKKAA